MTQVIINDFVENKRTKIIYVSEDFALTESVWTKSDQLLRDLQHLAMFTGRNCWCDLDPPHYREMIAKNLQYISKLPVENRLDEDDPVVASLNFLVCTLIYCIEQKSHCYVECLKINRVGDFEVSIEFSAEMEMDAGPPEKKKADTPNGGITVVVDNT